MNQRTSTLLSPFQGPSIRVLIIPGLNNSGQDHWQSWLQTQYRGARRVAQLDWSQPELAKWSERIDQTLATAPAHTQWIAVAHSFGCLALADHLSRTRAKGHSAGQGVCAALMVAPADPLKFKLADRLPHHGLGIPATLIGSENDPWMPLSRARDWAATWGAGFLNLGLAGHINAEAGFGPWPLARYKVDQLIQHIQRERRIERAHPMEFNYGV